MHTTAAEWVLLSLLGVCAASPLHAATLKVGPDRDFARIEDANALALPGDVIEVYPVADGQPHARVAVRVRRPGLTFRGRPGPEGGYVKLSGEGIDFGADAPRARAIFHLDPGADRCVIEGFDLSGAHSPTAVVAALQIDQADDVTIRNCRIHDNDLGIRSSGGGAQRTCRNLLIESCAVGPNGHPVHKTRGHNLFLDGNSVTLRFCDIQYARTGHNVKSRARSTRIAYCYVHDSANREFDLIADPETPASRVDALLVGNVFVKADPCPGNRSVIHFWQEGGDGRTGTLTLIHNTVVTPYVTPAFLFRGTGCRAQLIGNLICDGGGAEQPQTLILHRAGARGENVNGSHNWFSGRFARQPGLKIDWGTCSFGPAGTVFFRAIGEHDYRLDEPPAGIVDGGMALEALASHLPGAEEEDRGGVLSRAYQHPAGKTARAVKGKPDIGAYEWEPAEPGKAAPVF